MPAHPEPRERDALIPCVQIAVIGRQAGAELGGGLAARDRDVPMMTWVNGTLMARRPVPL